MKIKFQSMIACFKVFSRNLLNYFTCLFVIVMLILFSGCEKDPETNNPDSYSTSIQLISARQITLTSYEVIISTEVGEKITKAELIFDDITILTSNDIIFNIELPEKGEITDTVAYDLKRFNHDFQVKARLILEEDTVYSNEIVVRTVKNTYNIALYKDDLYYDPVINIALSLNKDEGFSLIIEFNNLYIPKSTELKLNRTISLRHLVNFNDCLYTSDGLETYANGYLDNNVAAGVYEVYFYIDGIEFKADSKIQVLENGWSLINSNFPGDKLYEYSSFVIGDNLYITGGQMDGFFQVINKIWKYSFTNNTWQRNNNFPAEDVVISQSSMKHNGKGYVMLRNNIKHYANELWEYNEITDEWKLTTTFPGTGNYLTCFVIKNKLYAGGGRQRVNEEVIRYSDFWSYDFISKTWERLNDLPFKSPVPVTLSCASVDHGFVYIFDNSFWAYDPANDSWALKAEFPGPRRSHGNVTCLNNKVYLIGSMYYSTPIMCGLKDCWEYDTEADKWELNSFVPSYANTGLANTYNNSLISGLGFAPIGYMDFYEPNLYIMTP